MKKILIVDDELFFLQGLKKTLECQSAEVVAVDSGAAALREIAQSFYDLCLLDVFLADAEGTEVLKKIKEVSPQTKVVIMTAGLISGEMENTIENNAYMFVSKPFDLLQLRMMVKRILEEGV